MTDVINFTTLLLSALSPIAVALIRRCRWPDEVAALLAFGVVTVIYTAGRALDGALAWPLGPEFAVGLAAAFGAQQVVYQMTKHTAPMQRLTAFGDSAVELRARMDPQYYARGSDTSRD